MNGSSEKEKNQIIINEVAHAWPFAHKTVSVGKAEKDNSMSSKEHTKQCLFLEGTRNSKLHTKYVVTLFRSVCNQIKRSNKNEMKIEFFIQQILFTVLYVHFGTEIDFRYSRVDLIKASIKRAYCIISISIIIDWQKKVQINIELPTYLPPTNRRKW